MGNWEFIKEFYTKNGVFECSGVIHKKTKEIAVVHVLSRPASEGKIRKLEEGVGKQLTQSHRSLLLFSNGCTFYTQKTLWWCESGFKFYSTKELPVMHRKRMEQLGHPQAIEQYFGGADVGQQMLEADKQVYIKWLDSLLIIGEELQSSNYIAIDYSRNGKEMEHPIVFISHEIPYELCKDSDKYDASKILGQSVDEVLVLAAKNPPNFLMEVLGGCSVYSDGKTDEQWFPDRYKIAGL
jgi:hypothetical protein